MKLRFGRYRGWRLQDCPPDYLCWLLRQNWLGAEFREQVETVLAPDNVCCLGPRWWHLQRQIWGRALRVEEPFVMMPAKEDRHVDARQEAPRGD